MRAAGPLLLFVTLISLFAVSQEANQYTDQPYVVESAETFADFQNDGNFTRRERVTVLVQSDAGLQQWGNLRFAYASEHNEIKVTEVSVRKKDGTVLKTDTAALQDLPSAITQAMPYYSDLREKHAVVRGLNVGDRLTYEYTVATKAPLIPGHFWFDYNFAEDAIHLKETVFVSAPAEREIKLRSVGTTPSVEKVNGRVTYKWSHKNLSVPDPAKKNEEGPDPDDVLSRSAPPQIQISTFKSWEEIGSWFYKLQAQHFQLTPDVERKVNEIVAGKSSQEEKAKALAAFVGTNIRYVGIEFGIGRFQPHAPAEVLGNAFGDCKDKHMLLAAMLKVAGIEADPVLISTKLAIDKSVPTISVFDHLITRAKVGGKIEWIDTTGEIYPVAYLPPHLRDKDVVVAGTVPSVAHTPALPVVASFESFDLDGELDAQGTMKGKITLRFQGDTAVLMRTVFRKVPQSQWQQVMQSVSAMRGFGGTVSNVTASSPEDLSSEFTVMYDYTREDYAGFKEGYTSPGFPTAVMVSARDLEKRKTPVVFNPVGITKASSRIKMPSGTTLNVPKAFEYSSELGDYRTTYGYKDGVLSASRTLSIKKQIVPPSAFAELKLFATAVNDDDSRISMGKKGAAPFVADSTEKKSNREADELFEKSKTAFDRRDMRAVVSTLQHLLKVDPTYERAWGAMGAAYLAMGNTQEGIDALKKEIELHPKTSLYSYKTLSEYYSRTGRIPQAVTLWQQYLKEIPEDPEAKVTLGRLYVRQKLWKEAAGLFEDALKTTPESGLALLEAGNAQLEAGNIGLGYKHLQHAVEVWPRAKNDAAYFLMKKNVHMQEALQWSEEAVKEVEQASAKMTLTNISMEDNATTGTLTAYWDTLGWGYYQTGDYSAAAKYLGAGFAISQSSVQGEHYAQALEKLGRKTEAIEVYSIIAGDRGDAAQRAKKKLQELAPARASKLISDSPARASRARNHKVPGLKTNKNYSADVLLLVSNAGTIEDVKWIDDDNNTDAFLTSAKNKIKTLKLGLEFPSERPAKVLREGVFMCTTITGCNLTLLTPGMVQSVTR